MSAAVPTKSAAAYVADCLAAGEGEQALRAARRARIVGGGAAEELALAALGARVRRKGRRPAALALHLLRRGDWRQEIALEDEDVARAERRKRRAGAPAAGDLDGASAAEVIGPLMAEFARRRAISSGDRRC